MTVLMGEPSVHEFMAHNDRGIMPRTLRTYQEEARDAVLADWAAGTKRVGVVLPTGSGKSTVIGALVQWAWHAGYRVLMIAHRAELLDQMIRDTKAVAPEIPEHEFGIVRAEHDDHHAFVVAATFQTLAKAHRREALGQRDVLIVDETHHIVATGYHATFAELGGYDGAFCCGFTATMYRGDVTKGKTAEIGLGDVIEKISYEKNLRWAIEQGFLVMPRGLTVRIEALNQLNKIKNVAGDFHQGQLAEIMEAAVEYTVDAVEQHCRDRQSIIFGASVEACRQITAQINERGTLRAATVTGDISYDERQPIYAAFRTGEINCLVTVFVLSEGADFPMCDCVVMGRPTRSRIAYSQMVGRALRTHPGKTDALVLDLAGSVRQMKLIHLSELVHGMGLEITEVDDEGTEIEVPVCPVTGEPVNTCMCEMCVNEREANSGGRVKGPQRMGVVDVVAWDLLNNGSDTLWLETPAGVPFIGLDEGWNLFLWPEANSPEAGRWAVGTISTRKRVDNGDGTTRPDGGFCYFERDEDGNETNTVAYFTRATAATKAEDWAVDNRFVLPSKNASWRRRNQGPSELQSSYARRLGIATYDRMTKGRLSDEISISLAAAVLDSTIVAVNE